MRLDINRGRQRISVSIPDEIERLILIFFFFFTTRVKMLKNSTFPLSADLTFNGSAAVQPYSLEQPGM